MSNLNSLNQSKEYIMCNKSPIAKTTGNSQATDSKSARWQININKKQKTMPISVNNSVICNAVSNSIKSNPISQVRFKNYESSGLVDPNIRNL